jgi:PHD/YefM family antitoxin component YafN of YafNO toxin-antitoxin module
MLEAMEPKWISMARLAKHAERIVEDISSTGAMYLVTRRGRSGVLLVNEDYFETLRGQLEIATNPKLREQIDQGRRDVAEGRYRTLEEVEKELGLDRPARSQRRRPARRASAARRAKGSARASRARTRTV